MLNRLHIEHVRNLQSSTLDLAGGINIVHGKNASGKTSLLEAIHLLARGRSFRTNRIRHILNKQQSHFSIQALTSRSTATIDRVAVHYSKDEKRLFLRGNGKNLSRSSDLTAYLPIALIHPDSHRLIDASPSYRRQFLDWGVFHVEHSYLPEWRRYQRALRQRNAVIRQHMDDARIWTPELVASGLCVDRHRRDYLGIFTELFNRYSEDFLGISDEIVLEYKQGWNNDQSLEESFNTSLERDQKLGYTHSGPHRCDIQFQINGQAIGEYVSRGQQKLLIFALYLSQVETYRRYTGNDCMLLIDDYSAELDAGSIKRSLSVFKDANIQSVFTFLGSEISEEFSALAERVFHVKHGSFQ